METLNENEINVIENLDVAEARNVFVASKDSTEPKICENHKAVWNLSKNLLGCIASKKYEIIQHREVVKALIEAVKNPNINYKVNVKEDMHKIFADIEFTDAKIELTELNEEFVAGLRVINSYNKTTGLIIQPRLVRLACLNGMIVNRFQQGYSIRHSQKLVKKFKKLIQIALKNTINENTHLKELVNKSIKDSVEYRLVNLILENLIGREKHIKAIAEKLKGIENPTRWDIYNAITSYATHDEQLKPSIEAWLQNKAQNLLEKPLEVYAQERENFALSQEA